MANIKSAAKQARRSLVQRAVNRRNRTILRSAVKNARGARNAPGVEIGKEVSALYSALDRAVYKGILHKNAAARHKQRIVKLLRGAQKPSG